MAPVVCCCALLGAMTLIAFWPVFQNDFVRYDDPDYVTENLHVLKGLSWANVGWAFAGGHAGNWHPLTWLSHMLDVQLFGLNAAGHHAINLLIHVGNTLVLFLLLKRMTGAFWRSGLVAAFFGVHPLHVESVAWIAERKDVLSLFFGLLCLWAYVIYVEKSTGRNPSSGSTNAGLSLSQGSAAPPGDARRRWLFYAAALVLFALALMSKPMLVTLPYLLLLLDWWPLRRLEFPVARLQPATWACWARCRRAGRALRNCGWAASACR